jgi:hypothetical protein
MPSVEVVDNSRRGRPSLPIMRSMFNNKYWCMVYVYRHMPSTAAQHWDMSYVYWHMARTAAQYWYM